MFINSNELSTEKFLTFIQIPPNGDVIRIDTIVYISVVCNEYKNSPSKFAVVIERNRPLYDININCKTKTEALDLRDNIADLIGSI